MLHPSKEAEELYKRALEIEESNNESHNDESIGYLTKGVELNDAWCQYTLGIEYLNGQSVAKDLDKGFCLIESAANNGLKFAMGLLADCYLRGRDRPKDPGKALFWYRKANEADPQNGEILGRIGDFYHGGWGIQRNDAEAMKYYQKAWECGYTPAAADLGCIYSLGEGVENNDATAAKWFQRAADKNDNKGRYFLGLWYHEGYGGLPQSDKMAYKYMLPSAREGYFSSLRYLFRTHCFRVGTEEEYAEIFNACAARADEGDLDMQYEIGIAYADGEGVPVDTAKAEKLLITAANAGHVQSALDLGRAYSSGYRNFEKNPEKALKYFNMAAEKGNANAMHEIGQIYKMSTYYQLDTAGQNTDKIALEWFVKAADAGYSFSGLEAGIQYLEGKGCETDYNKAYHYLCIAVEDEIELAYIPIVDCLLHGTGTPAGYSEAYKYLSLAMDSANQKDYMKDQKPEIEYRIGLMYENGWGFSRNYDTAIKHYNNSAEMGCKKAKEALTHFKRGLLGWSKI